MTGTNQTISKIIDALRRIYTVLEGAPGVALCGVDISGRQIVALLLINEHGPLKVSRLAALMSLKLSAVSTSLNHLEQLGLISRNQSTDDRRVVTLSLTETGRQTTGEVITWLNNFMDAMELHDTGKLEAIHYSLECIINILENEII